MWTPFSEWNGTVLVLYRSLDNMDRLILMEETEEKNYAALGSGKVM